MSRERCSEYFLLERNQSIGWWHLKVRDSRLDVLKEGPGAGSVVCKVCSHLQGLTGKTGDAGEKLELAIQGLAQFES